MSASPRAPLLLLALAYILVVAPAALALENGVARTPPMGWLSWERFACNVDCDTYPDECINDKLYMRMADRLAADHWVDAGYEYVNIDDCWAELQRDATNTVVADKKRFPNGIKAVCDYIHSKGLKCGLYTDIGTVTCGGYPGLNTANNITQTQADIDLFISWGIDSLKVDGCNAETSTMGTTYPAVNKMLAASGRKVMYSCSWPAYIPDHMTPEVYQSLQTNCNIWRNWNDISDSWASVVSIIGWWKKNADMVKYAQPGAFNDPDMIIAGNQGLSRTQQEAQMALWGIFAAPLLLSVDLALVPAETKAILTNPTAIAINQDALGKQGTCVIDKDPVTVWSRPLTNGRFAVAILNTSNGVPSYPQVVTFTSKDVGLADGQAFRARNVFTGADLGAFEGAFTGRVAPSSVLYLLVEPATTTTRATTTIPFRGWMKSTMI